MNNESTDESKEEIIPESDTTQLMANGLTEDDTTGIPDEETEGEEPDLAGYNESLKETQKEQEPESIHELPNSDNGAGVETAWALVDSATTQQDKTYAMSAGRGLLVKVIRGESVSVTFVEEARMVKDENGQVIIK
jgi:hypothetical protein